MKFIARSGSILGNRQQVDAFLAMRAQFVGATPDWQRLRKQLAASYRVMADALYEVRTDEGKATQPHHYANEARLVNWVMFGKFDPVDRELLSPSDLGLLEVLESRNAIWIARGRNYKERKASLPEFLLSMRNGMHGRLT